MTFYDLSVRIVRCEYYRNDRSWNYPNMVYPFDTFYFVLGGDGNVRTEWEQIRLLPDHIYLIPANVRHHSWCETAIEKVYMEAYLELLPGLGIFGDETRIRSIPTSRESTLGLQMEKDTGLKAQLLLRSTLLQAASGLLRADWSPPDERVYRFRQILSDIQMNIKVRLSAEEIARRHGWNSSYLSRVFHREFGVTLKQYMDQMLMKNLRQELILSVKTVRELAAEYGFGDAYGLSAYFKRHEGISPLHYRESHVHI